jgi:hypothetical protein
MGVPRVGRGRRQVQWTHLLPHIPRDALDSRLYFTAILSQFINPQASASLQCSLLGITSIVIETVLPWLQSA